MSANEFSRTLRLDALGEAPRDVAFVAEPAERAALAARFGLLAIDRLTVAAAVSRAGTAVIADGRVSARVVQSCVATDLPLPAEIDAPFSLRFVPEADAAEEEEIELSDSDCDTLTYVGGAADLGEAAAETLLLALDPFPRAPDSEIVLREAGVIDEETVAVAPREGKANPFAALKALKDKLSG